MVTLNIKPSRVTTNRADDGRNTVFFRYSWINIAVTQP